MNEQPLPLWQKEPEGQDVVPGALMVQLLAVP